MSAPENLFRVVRARDWEEALATGRVPRCASDERAGHVHLSERRAVETIADAWFEPHEAPVALEIDRARVEPRLEWSAPSESKPWPQAHLKMPNVLTEFVVCVHPLRPPPERAQRLCPRPAGASDGMTASRFNS